MGKSVIFNHLTGLHQHIGNWPGKTVEKAEGTLHFKGYTIDIIDLPGIYSLSTFSIEELVSREYIAIEKPDLVINVVDASVLERNLFFTLQLLELETPMIVALNQVDMAKKKGITIDHEKLGELLGVPVIPTVAVSGVGIYDLLEKSVETIRRSKNVKPVKAKYGKEIEERIKKIARLIEKTQFRYPARWVAIKLLEEDEQVKKEILEINPKIVLAAENLAAEIEEIHGHSCSTVITSERYQAVSKIAHKIQEITPQLKPPMRERMHALTTHRILGYVCVPYDSTKGSEFVASLWDVAKLYTPTSTTYATYALDEAEWAGVAYHKDPKWYKYPMRLTTQLTVWQGINTVVIVYYEDTREF